MKKYIIFLLLYSQISIVTKDGDTFSSAEFEMTSVTIATDHIQMWFSMTATYLAQSNEMALRNGLCVKCF